MEECEQIILLLRYVLVDIVSFWMKSTLMLILVKVDPEFCELSEHWLGQVFIFGWIEPSDIGLSLWMKFDGELPKITDQDLQSRTLNELRVWALGSVW